MVKTFREIIEDGIQAEKEAISYYTFLFPFVKDGNDRRSIRHILNEEKDHLKILEKIKKKF